MRLHVAAILLAAPVLLSGVARAQQLDLSTQPNDVNIGKKEYSPGYIRGVPMGGDLGSERALPGARRQLVNDGPHRMRRTPPGCPIRWGKRSPGMAMNM